MGLLGQVNFEHGRIPTWTEVSELLRVRAFPIQLRMIDGELALPDELPSESWQELRIGTPHGMVTLRREPTRIQFVIWGNAEPALQTARHVLAWTFAELGNGTVETEAGGCSPAEFARQIGLPASLVESR